MALKTRQETKTGLTSIQKATEREKPFSKINFWMMAGCLILILLGYLFMSGGGSTEPDGFNPEIFSTRRIVVGPLLCFLGFLFMAFAIICPPEKEWKFLRRFNKPAESRKQETEN